jgi:hypothetical protein
MELLMANEDPRYASRKWILTKWGLLMYTGVHIGNVWTMLLAAYMKLLPKSSLETLWAGSVTVWSAGVAALLAIYMAGNVGASIAYGKGAGK